MLVAQNRKRKVARRLLLALKLQEQHENALSVVGRIESLADNVQTLEETVEKVNLREKDAATVRAPAAAGAASSRK